MYKYKNKDGIELNFSSMTEEGKRGSGTDLVQEVVREVVEEAIRILNSHNMFDKQSMGWAIDRCVGFLETNFDIKEKWNEVSNS